MANTDRLTGDELNSALTSELVGVHTGYLGHGPETASTFYRGNAVVTLMHDVLTKPRRSLRRRGGRRRDRSARTFALLRC
jgi:hypothetical protein